MIETKEDLIETFQRIDIEAPCSERLDSGELKPLPVTDSTRRDNLMSLYVLLIIYKKTMYELLGRKKARKFYKGYKLMYKRLTNGLR